MFPVSFYISQILVEIVWMDYLCNQNKKDLRSPFEVSFVLKWKECFFFF